MNAPPPPTHPPTSNRRALPRYCLLPLLLLTTACYRLLPSATAYYRLPPACHPPATASYRILPHPTASYRILPPATCTVSATPDTWYRPVPACPHSHVRNDGNGYEDDHWEPPRSHASSALCWGADFHGQSRVPPSGRRGMHRAGALFLALSTGDDTTCGITHNERLICWGRSQAAPWWGGDSLTTSFQSRESFVY